MEYYKKHKLEEIEGFTIARKVEEPELIVTAEEVDDEIEVEVQELQQEENGEQESSENVPDNPKKAHRYNKYKKKFKNNGNKKQGNNK